MLEERRGVPRPPRRAIPVGNQVDRLRDYNLSREQTRSMNQSSLGICANVIVEFLVVKTELPRPETKNQALAQWLPFVEIQQAASA